MRQARLASARIRAAATLSATSRIAPALRREPPPKYVLATRRDRNSDSDSGFDWVHNQNEAQTTRPHMMICIIAM